jgi:hypothetical protein
MRYGGGPAMRCGQGTIPAQLPGYLWLAMP